MVFFMFLKKNVLLLLLLPVFIGCTSKNENEYIANLNSTLDAINQETDVKVRELKEDEIREKEDRIREIERMDRLNQENAENISRMFEGTRQHLQYLQRLQNNRVVECQEQYTFEGSRVRCKETR